MNRIMIAGSRHLNDQRTADVVRVVVESAGHVITGCARGVDALTVKAAITAGIPLTVYAAMLHREAPERLRRAERKGAKIHYCAGGGEEVPEKAKLARRTKAAVMASETVCGLLCPKSRGTLLALKTAAELQKQVYALPCAGLEPQNLPVLAAGSWQPAKLHGVDCYHWQPHQTALF